MIHVTKYHWSKSFGQASFVLVTNDRIRNLPLIALAAAVGCGCAHPTTRSMAMSAETRDDNKRSVANLFETFNRGDLSQVDALVGPEYVGAQGDKGPAGFKTVVVGLRTAFPDLHYTVDDLVADGDRVAVRWHWTGTHRGPFRGFPPTGKTVSNSGTGIFRLRDGKIVGADLETDRLGFLEQIGVVPEGVGRGPRPTVPASP
jgi:steroid delta-isomerase-like uncharacterized protein